jgi:hypothetical protein
MPQKKETQLTSRRGTFPFAVGDLSFLGTGVFSGPGSRNAAVGDLDHARQPPKRHGYDPNINRDGCKKILGDFPRNFVLESRVRRPAVMAPVFSELGGWIISGQYAHCWRRR